uniref:Prefoldin subunit 4 n=1 Tax=Schistosoma japonicum TaxID=6182 RepID=C1LHR8_SCHJA|nr:prefoldin subunit 4 [Schistosoma japonicum]
MAEDIEVTHEDQQKINSFATWNLKFKDYTLDYDEKKKELANLNDAEDELVIIDGDVHPYLIGETFFHLPNDRISDELSEAKEGLKLRLVDLEERIRDCKVHMGSLKKDLYGKFGNHINLEED